MRVFALALALAMLAAGSRRLDRRSGPGQLLGRRPAGDADPRTAAAPEGGRGRQHPGPGRLERDPADQGRPVRLDRRRRRHRRRRQRPDRGAAVPHRRPDLGGADGRPLQEPAEPPGQDRPPEIGLEHLRRRSGPPLRADRDLLDRQPAPAAAPDPDLAGLERAELHVLRRPSEPGRIRAAGEAHPLGAEGRRPGVEADPRRPLRAARGGEPAPQAPARLLRRRFPRTALRRHARDQEHVPGGRAPPLHRDLQAARTVRRRSPRRAEGEP